MTEDDQDLLERIEAIIANAWDDDEHQTLSEVRDRIEALSAENERLNINGIHSCHDQCERPLCVLERENDGLKGENERLRNALSWAEKVDPDLVFAIRFHASCGAVK